MRKTKQGNCTDSKICNLMLAMGRAARELKEKNKKRILGLALTLGRFESFVRLALNRGQTHST